MKWKFSLILGFMGRLNDRFSSYNPNLEFEEKVSLSSKVEGLKGLELIYPSDFKNIALTQKALANHNLEVSTVNVNLKFEPKFHLGSLTNRDPSIRQEAVQYMKTSMDLAKQFGCNMITMAPLADGYDYPFESEYTKAWRWFLDGVGESAAYNPDIKVSLEYKQSEPRAHVILPNAGTALAACLQVGLPNVGVTMDMGHAYYISENPAQSISLLAQANRLFLVHVNDNYRNWDWDMIVGSINPWELVEMMLYLDEVGYQGWLTSDVAPFRIDSVKTFSATYKSLLWAEKVIERIGREKLWRQIREGSPVDTLTELQKIV